MTAGDWLSGGLTSASPSGVSSVSIDSTDLTLLSNTSEGLYIDPDDVGDPAQHQTAFNDAVKNDSGVGLTWSGGAATQQVSFEIEVGPDRSGTQELLIDYEEWAELGEVQDARDAGGDITISTLEVRAGQTEVAVVFDADDGANEGTLTHTVELDLDGSIDVDQTASHTLTFAGDSESVTYRATGVGATGISHVDAVNRGIDLDTGSVADSDIDFTPNGDWTPAAYHVWMGQEMTFDLPDNGNVVSIYSYAVDNSGNVKRGSLVEEVGTAPGKTVNVAVDDTFTAGEKYILEMEDQSEAVFFETQELSPSSQWSSSEVSFRETVRLDVSTNDITGGTVTVFVYDEGGVENGEIVTTQNGYPKPLRGTLDGSGETTFDLDPVEDLDGSGDYQALVIHDGSESITVTGFTTVSSTGMDMTLGPKGKTILSSTAEGLYIDPDDVGEPAQHQTAFNDTVKNDSSISLTRIDGTATQQIQLELWMDTDVSGTQELILDYEEWAGIGEIDAVRDAGGNIPISNLEKRPNESDVAVVVDADDVTITDRLEHTIELDLGGVIDGDRLVWHTLSLGDDSRSMPFLGAGTGATGISHVDAANRGVDLDTDSVADSDVDFTPNGEWTPAAYHVWMGQEITLDLPDISNWVRIYSYTVDNSGNVARGTLVRETNPDGQVSNVPVDTLTAGEKYILEMDGQSEAVFLETQELSSSSQWSSSEVSSSETVWLDISTNDYTGGTVSILVYDDGGVGLGDIVTTQNGYPKPIRTTLDGDGEASVAIDPNGDLDGTGEYQALLTSSPR